MSAPTRTISNSWSCETPERERWPPADVLLPVAAGSARASIAHGSINNFDTVNDTGHECHGFVIEPAGGAPAQVLAVIEPPEPPEVPVLEFGVPVWVKEIRTTTHNDREVKLRDLVSDDPGDPDDRNWRNGEPDEVEVEWQLLQTEFNQPDGGNNAELQAEPEDLPGGDEVVTRRYEFFQYTGPIDEESGEAKCDNVGPDNLHGAGLGEVNGEEVDFSTIEVVGAYTGAQMAAVDVEAGVDLTEHVGDGSLGAPDNARRVIIQGTAPFTATTTSARPIATKRGAGGSVVARAPAFPRTPAVSLSPPAPSKFCSRTHRPISPSSQPQDHSPR